MHTFSIGELALIFGIVIVLFGGSRLASVGKSLGEGIANFKKGLNDTPNDSDKQLKAPLIQQNQVQAIDDKQKDSLKV